MRSFLSAVGPGYEPALGQPERGEEGDGERREQHDRGVGARGLELGDRLEHEVAEPLARAGVLGEHGADDRDRDGDPRPAQGAGEGGGQLGQPEGLPAGGVERALEALRA